VAKLRKRRAGPKPGGWVGQQRAPTEQIAVGDSECREKSPVRRPWWRSAA